MEYLVKHWAQIVVIIGAFGFLLKLILDYKFKTKELRYRYFYEKKAAKIVVMHEEIVVIKSLLIIITQIMISK